MKTICPHCKQEYSETPDEYLGMTLQCSVCQKEFVCKYPKKRSNRPKKNKLSKIQKLKAELEERIKEIKSKQVGNIDGSGLTFRDGKLRNYGPIERLIQSDAGVFLRAGGIKYLLKSILYSLKGL